MRRTLVLLATPSVACALSGCGQAAPPAVQAPLGAHIQLVVNAPRTTHYEMLCQVRTYQPSPGQYVNRYGVDRTGPLTDVIPSPHAHCTAKIDSGPAPVRVTLTKAGASRSMTLDTVGDDGKKTLQVW